MSHDVQRLISKHGILSNKGSTEKATDPARFKVPPRSQGSNVLSPENDANNFVDFCSTMS